MAFGFGRGGGGGRGGPSGPAAQSWDDMYLHQKIKHLADTAGGQIFALSSWWLPAIALSSAITVIMFSGPMGVPQLLQTASTTFSPIPAPSTFGHELQMPPREGGGGGGGGDDFDEEE
jgi:hypothetical protein